MDRKELRDKIKFIFTHNNKIYNRKLSVLQSNEELITEIYNQTLYLNTNSIIERIYHIFNDLTSEELCPICNKNKLNLINFVDGYKKYCSVECLNKSKIGKPGAMLGIKRPAAFGENIRKRMKGTHYAMGVVRSSEVRKRMSDTQKKKGPKTEEQKIKISKALKGRKRSPESVRKQRLTFIIKINKDLENFGKTISPRINQKALKYFQLINDTFNLKGKYGNDGFEYYDSDLGRWFDYIDHENYIIIEWDEEYHYNGNEIKQKDLDRQKEIQEKYYYYTFIRIREKIFFELTDNEKLAYIVEEMKNGCS